MMRTIRVFKYANKRQGMPVIRMGYAVFQHITPYKHIVLHIIHR